MTLHLVNRLSTAFSINNKLPSWNIVLHHVHFPELFFMEQALYLFI